MASLEDVETQVRGLPYTVDNWTPVIRVYMCGCKERVGEGGITLCPYHLDMVDTVEEEWD